MAALDVNFPAGNSDCRGLCILLTIYITKDKIITLQSDFKDTIPLHKGAAETAPLTDLPLKIHPSP